MSLNAGDNSKTGHDSALMRQMVSRPHNKNNIMSPGTILLIILILMLVGAFPSWPHSKGWGYYPSGLLGLVLTVLIIMLLLGRI